MGDLPVVVGRRVMMVITKLQPGHQLILVIVGLLCY
jgi:hypothetical protein